MIKAVAILRHVFAFSGRQTVGISRYEFKNLGVALRFTALCMHVGARTFYAEVSHRTNHI